MIERLSLTDWSRLWFMVRLISQAAQGRRTAIPEDWFAAVGSLCPRIALIMINRVEDQEAERRLSRDCFIDYVGDDTEILTYAARIEVMEAGHRPIDWDHVQHLSRLARKVGLHRLFLASRALPPKVPEAVAINVLSDCENHCLQMVEICEQAYATTIAQTARRVAHVAESDGWFTTPA